MKFYKWRSYILYHLFLCIFSVIITYIGLYLVGYTVSLIPLLLGAMIGGFLSELHTLYRYGRKIGKEFQTAGLDDL